MCTCVQSTYHHQNPPTTTQIFSLLFRKILTILKLWGMFWSVETRMLERGKDPTRWTLRETNTHFFLPVCTPRNSFDKWTNASGTQLTQLCRTLGLYIVNSRIWGDHMGRYTYNSAPGCSTVDYFITDLDPVSLRLQGLVCFTILHPSQTTAKLQSISKRHSQTMKCLDNVHYTASHTHIDGHQRALGSTKRLWKTIKYTTSLTCFCLKCFPIMILE